MIPLSLLVLGSAQVQILLIGGGVFGLDCGRETFRTGAPKNQLRFFDRVTGIGRGACAVFVANGAIDIRGLAALPANHVVVIVLNAIFVKRGRTGRLNTPDNALLGKDAKGVVDRLSRDSSNFGAHVLGDFVSGAVRAVGDRAKHGQALRGDLDAVMAQYGDGVGEHGTSIPPNSGLSQVFGFIKSNTETGVRPSRGGWPDCLGVARVVC